MQTEAIMKCEFSGHETKMNGDLGLYLSMLKDLAGLDLLKHSKIHDSIIETRRLIYIRSNNE